VLLRDGRVVFVPHNAKTIGIFNPATNAYSTIPGMPGGAVYIGGALLPDGRVVFIPCIGTTIGIFDPTTNAYSTIAGPPSVYAYDGKVLLNDGRVLLVPHDAKTIGILTVSDEKARRRAHSRTDALKQELVAAAWHPKRMSRWCLDEDERREFAEMGLGLCDATA
jgi:streptogramin lyase